MNREKIEKAAEDFVMQSSPSYTECFLEGADWRINSVWHNNIKAGKIEKAILVKFNDGLFNLFGDIRDLKGIEDKIETFAYIEDLLPNKED